MGIELHDHQTTIKSRVTLSGIGVHSGKPVTVQFGPADADTGIVFHCLGAETADNELRALVSEVGGTDLSTILGDLAKHHVATVEHLMATVFALGIDNLSIDIDGSEVPILDGSAAMFVEAFDQAGIEVLQAKRRYIRILKPVRIESGASWAEFRPYDGTRFEVEIDFESPAIGRQFFAADLSAEMFRSEVSRARTFGFMKDVERSVGGRLCARLFAREFGGDRRRPPHHQHGRPALPGRIRAPQGARRDGRPGVGRCTLHRLFPLLSWRPQAECDGIAQPAIRSVGVRDRRGDAPRTWAFDRDDRSRAPTYAPWMV